MSDQPEAGDKGRIPLRLRIGVTGHRQLDDEQALSAQVRRAIERIRQLAPSSPHTPLLFTVVSPLAEGADRLVAREVLKDERADLEAPMPLPREEYLKDFESDQSKGEFSSFLARAKVVAELPPCGRRDEAYERVGRYVVDRSDVLIALWDGEPSRGQGGTAEIVAHARERGVPLMWIATKGRVEIVEELGKGLSLPALQELNEYNQVAIGRERFEQRPAVYWLRPEDGPRSSLPLDAFSEWIAPYFLRADSLAQRYQLGYHMLGNALFLFAAAAVAAIAGQFIFAPEVPELAWIEFGLLVGLMMIVAVGRWRRFRDRWISYRFLAERFRSAFFLALAGLDVRREARPNGVYPGRPSDEWVGRAFVEVWDQRPRTQLAESDVENLRRFLATAWIEDQRRYHEKMSKKHGRRHWRLSRLSELLLAATVLAAVLHATGVGEHDSIGPLEWSDLLVFLAISLPALAAAISGIRVQREYERNAERYSGMRKIMEGLRARMESAADLGTVRGIAIETEELMLQENSDWFALMRFRGLEWHA